MQKKAYQKATRKRNDDQYFTVKRGLISRTDLSYVQKLVLCVIDSKSGSDGSGCYWDNEYIAEYLGCEKETARNAISHLKSIGLIEVFPTEHGRCTRINRSPINDTPLPGSPINDTSVIVAGLNGHGGMTIPKTDLYIDRSLRNTIENTKNPTPSLVQNSDLKNSPANSEGETSHRETSNPNLAGATPPSSADLDEYETYAEQVLAKPTGAADWENRNPYMLAGRRPMLKFPEIHLGRAELAEVLRQYDRARIPRNRFPEALAMCVGRLQTLKANGQNPERAAVFNWLTTWIKNELLNAIINETRLAKVEGRI